jgi:uncharacterized membrane protein
MGFADAIPGVSGGTMALILGIYERFIAALGSIGPAMLPMLLKGAFWKEVVASLGPNERPLTTDPVQIAARHIGFLFNVVVGILSGLLVGIAILPGLMENFPEGMRGFFFGLVLASIIVPWRSIRKRTSMSIVIFVVTCIATFYVMGLQRSVSGFATTTVTMSTADGKPLAADRTIRAAALKFSTSTGQKKLKREKAFQPKTELTLKAGESSWTMDVVASQGGKLSNLEAGALVQVVNADEHVVMTDFKVTHTVATTGGTDPALWYVFVCGAIAICAMLLPGVSGSFLLLMFGLYGYILHTARAMIYTLDFSLAPVIGIFLLGIIVGILGFSRFLRWLLATAHDATMAFLAGLMLGSLRALWPFQAGVGRTAHNTLPAAFDGTVALALGAMLAGIAIVAALYLVGNRLRPQAS